MAVPLPRGKVMMNSVNAPASVSTSILPPMLLDNDVMSYRKAEPRSSTGRLGGEERIEYLLFYIGRDTKAVITDTDFHRAAKVPGRGQ